MNTKQQPEDKEVALFIEKIGDLVVVDQTSYTVVIAAAKAARAKERELKERCLGITRPMHESIAAVISLFAGPMERLQGFQKKAKQIGQDWLDGERAKEREAQRILDQAAAKERVRMEAEAARQREREAAELRKAEAARKAAQATKDKAERERKEAEARAAEEKARAAQAKASAKQHIAETVKAAKVKSTVQTHGMSQTVNYEPVVEDKRMFVEWCLRTDRLEYLDVNIPLIKRDCQAAKGTRTFEGIRIVQGHTTRMTE